MEIARVLPEPWNLRLAEAAQVADPFERRKAIEEVIRRLRLAHPELFRQERGLTQSANFLNEGNKDEIKS